MNRWILLLLIAGLSTAVAQAPSPRLPAVREGAWMRYQVPMQPGVAAPCCIDGATGNGRCRLGDRDWNSTVTDSMPRSAPGDAMHVYLRQGADGIDRMQAAHDRCPVDTGAAEVTEAGTLAAADSIDLLQSEAVAPALRGKSLALISWHEGDAADRALQAAAGPGQPKALRRDAVFWSALSRGDTGLQHLRAMLQDEADASMRRHLVFALGLSEAAGALPALKRVARNDADPVLQAEALFWLARRGDTETEALVQRMLDTPESQCQHRRAVFALSQLPPARAVPALRRLVEHGGDRRLRKEAMFWLAQVDDDAVIPVFDQLLGAKPPR